MGRGRTLVKGTLLLTLSGLALRGLGVLFQTILARRIGAEGMGILQLILTVGGFAGTIGSAGVRVAALQLSARAWGRGDRAGVSAALFACLRYALVTGAAAGAALVLLAGIRERMEESEMPTWMKGFPGALIMSGLMAMAFMGFNGLI